LTFCRVLKKIHRHDAIRRAACRTDIGQKRQDNTFFFASIVGILAFLKLSPQNTVGASPRVTRKEGSVQAPLFNFNLALVVVVVEGLQSRQWDGRCG
jgi:hypothetical protein